MITLLPLVVSAAFGCDTCSVRHEKSERGAACAECTPVFRKDSWQCAAQPSLLEVGRSRRMLAFCPEPAPCICSCDCVPVQYGTPLPPLPPAFVTLPPPPPPPDRSVCPEAGPCNCFCP